MKPTLKFTILASICCVTALLPIRSFSHPAIVEQLSHLKLKGAKVATEKQAKELTFTEYQTLEYDMPTTEVPNVTGIDTLGNDILGFAKKGDVVWDVHIVDADGRLKAIAWVHSETKQVRFLFLSGRTKDLFPWKVTYTKQELPLGGGFVQDPKNKNTSYYRINRSELSAYNPFTNKSAGLYRSTDAGQTWKWFTGIFEFNYLFINPNTGEFFAIIKDNPIETDKNGLLTIPGFVGKAIASKDGKHWRDIMGKRQYASMDRITTDPEHPEQVCLWSSFRGYELVAVDDNYTDWKIVSFSTGPIF